MTSKIEELIYIHYDFVDNYLYPKLEQGTTTEIFPLRAFLLNFDIEEIFLAIK